MRKLKTGMCIMMAAGMALQAAWTSPVNVRAAVEVPAVQNGSVPGEGLDRQTAGEQEVPVLIPEQRNEDSAGNHNVIQNTGVQTPETQNTGTRNAEIPVVTDTSGNAESAPEITSPQPPVFSTSDEPDVLIPSVPVGDPAEPALPGNPFDTYQGPEANGGGSVTVREPALRETPADPFAEQQKKEAEQQAADPFAENAGNGTGANGSDSGDPFADPDDPFADYDEESLNPFLCGEWSEDGAEEGETFGDDEDIEEQEKALINANADTPEMLALTAKIGDRRSDVVAIAKSQVGYKEGGIDLNAYARQIGHLNGQPWCATFFVWCMDQAGMMLGVEAPYSASTTICVGWFQRKGTWHNKSNRYWTYNGTVETGEYVDELYEPLPGDFAAVETASNRGRGPNHTALVVGVDSYYVYTIEGNWGGKVVQRKYNRSTLSNGGGRIMGFGSPLYGDAVQRNAEIKATQQSLQQTFEHRYAALQPASVTSPTGRDLTMEVMPLINKGIRLYRVPSIAELLTSYFETVAAEKHPVYWLRNWVNGQNYYTSSAAEYAELAEKDPAWIQEGVVFYGPDQTIGKPVFRLLQEETGVYFYTEVPEEYEAMAALGFRDNGVAFYVDLQGKEPVFRLYHMENNSYSLTKDAAAYQELVAAAATDGNVSAPDNGVPAAEEAQELRDTEQTERDTLPIVTGVPVEPEIPVATGVPVAPEIPAVNDVTAGEDVPVVPQETAVPEPAGVPFVSKAH